MPMSDDGLTKLTTGKKAGARLTFSPAFRAVTYTDNPARFNIFMPQ
jgi:hypothetical protein